MASSQRYYLPLPRRTPVSVGVCILQTECGGVIKACARGIQMIVILADNDIEILRRIFVTLFFRICNIYAILNTPKSAILRRNQGLFRIDQVLVRRLAVLPADMAVRGW